jgi:hypothetical protein
MSEKTVKSDERKVMSERKAMFNVECLMEGKSAGSNECEDPEG